MVFGDWQLFNQLKSRRWALSTAVGGFEGEMCIEGLIRVEMEIPTHDLMSMF